MPATAQDTRLTGRTALVTGASRGIGRAIAARLAARGAALLLHYVHARDRAESLAAEIHAAGGHAHLLQADLEHPDTPAALAHQVTHILQGQPLHILVNNAGVSRRAPIEDVSEADFARSLRVNLQAPFFLIQALLPHLPPGGRILNISSMGTRAAYPGMAAYAPAKAGLEALTLLLAEHLGPRGITVNAIRPGATATDMNPRATNPVTAAEIAATTALRRIGQPDDIAAIAAFLAGPDSAWITGQCIDASGGQRL